LLLWHVLSRVKDWRKQVFDDSDRLIMVFLAMLLANAAISYSYTKDVILSPVAPFYAAAVTIAFAHALRRLEAARSVHGFTLAATLALTLLTTGWAARLVGVHFVLHEHAFIVRNDWIWLGPAPDRWGLPRDPKGSAMVRQLYDEAVRMKVPGTYFYGPQSWRYFEVPW
jgi:hypothetical protein